MYTLFMTMTLVVGHPQTVPVFVGVESYSKCMSLRETALESIASIMYNATFTCKKQ